MISTQKLVRFVTSLVSLSLVLIFLNLCSSETTPNSEPEKGNTLQTESFSIFPDDVKPTCTIPNIADWFEDGNVSANGFVSPANSLTDFNTNCDFYTWSWRNFLWQTSPNPKGGFVFDTPPFYDLEGKNMVSNGAATQLRSQKVDGTGQAGGFHGVLMSQKDTKVNADGSLLYYAIHVNDVYAYFVSGHREGPLNNLNQFPTTQGEVDQIANYAHDEYGYTIKDAQTLTMELKSAWVRVDEGVDASNYLTIYADVPKFVPKNDQEWVWDGITQDKNVHLALVGYHLVGSVKGHPEMVWATFEHKNNVAMNNYHYLNSEGVPTEKTNIETDEYPKGEGWLLTNAQTKVEANNQEHMTLVDDWKKIKAEPGFTISPSSCLQFNPLGSHPGKESAHNNTDIISLNQSIHSQLSEGDVRSNYYLEGAVWTANGKIPGVAPDAPLAGSKKLANMTMETYFDDGSCFSCHKGGDLAGLSHIFGRINPLTKEN